MGCAQNAEEESSRATLILHKQNQSYTVSSAIIQCVDEIVSGNPDTDESYHIALDTVIELRLDDFSYTIEENEIVLMHPDGTRIWNSRGIQKKLIKSRINKIYPNHH